jgi:hypothetical protein
METNEINDLKSMKHNKSYGNDNEDDHGGTYGRIYVMKSNNTNKNNQVLKIVLSDNLKNQGKDIIISRNEQLQVFNEIRITYACCNMLKTIKNASPNILEIYTCGMLQNFVTVVKEETKGNKYIFYNKNIKDIIFYTMENVSYNMNKEDENKKINITNVEGFFSINKTDVYYSLGDIYGYFKSSFSKLDNDKVRLFKGILLQCLIFIYHGKRYLDLVHGDLKSNNLFLTNKKEANVLKKNLVYSFNYSDESKEEKSNIFLISEEIPLVKIADFGKASIKINNSEYSSKSDKITTDKSQDIRFLIYSLIISIFSFDRLDNKLDKQDIKKLYNNYTQADIEGKKRIIGEYSKDNNKKKELDEMMSYYLNENLKSENGSKLFEKVIKKIFPKDLWNLLYRMLYPVSLINITVELEKQKFQQYDGRAYFLDEGITWSNSCYYLYNRNFDNENEELKFKKHYLKQYMCPTELKNNSDNLKLISKTDDVLELINDQVFNEFRINTDYLIKNLNLAETMFYIETPENEIESIIF